MIPFDAQGVDAAVIVSGRQVKIVPFAAAAVLVPVATVRSSIGAMSAGVFFEDEDFELQPATTTSPRASTTAPTFRMFLLTTGNPPVPSYLLTREESVAETKESSLVT
ncbi:unannotated protein [freshwater metagenome]